MKYSEYQKLTKTQKSGKKPVSDCPASFQEYFEMRKKIEAFAEAEIDITNDLTLEDYEKFEENFEKIVKDLSYKDPNVDGCEMSTFEEISGMMHKMDWRWGIFIGGPRSPEPEELEEALRERFKECMEMGFPVARSSCGGWTVETDIYDHQVRVTFEHTSLAADDQEPYTYD